MWRKQDIHKRKIDSNGDIITDGNQIMVGGDDKYKAICRKCWKNKIKAKVNKEKEQNETAD